MLTHARLLELLHYDPETGIFTWRVNRYGCNGACRVKAGDVAGTRAKDGRCRICIAGHSVRSHRLAWFYMTGEWPLLIDHRNGDNSDDRWTNLRKATRSQNQFNVKRHVDNKSGVLGVYRYARSGKWLAHICVNYKRIHLGTFETREAAAEARRIAAIELHGVFATELRPK